MSGTLLIETTPLVRGLRDENQRLRLALENARRDLIGVCPKRGSKSPRRLIMENAIERIEAALSPHQGGGAA